MTKEIPMIKLKSARSGPCCLRSFVIACFLLTPLVAQAADEKPLAISFDTVEGLTCKPIYKCVEAKAAVVEHDRREGSCSMSTTWKAAADSYGSMSLEVEIPPTDFSGKSFAVAVKPLTDNCGYWGIELYDAEGKKAEEHRLFAAPANRWTTLNFTQGVKPQYGHLASGKGDIKRIKRLGFRAQTKAADQTASALWDDFRVISPVVKEKIMRSSQPPETPATLVAAGTKVWLDASQGYALKGTLLAGRWLESSAKDPYPSFTFLDETGKSKTLSCTDKNWRVAAAPEESGKLAVTYACDSATVKVLWTAAPERIQCDVSVASEGGWKAASVGTTRLFGTVLGEKDYGIPPTGYLPMYTKEPIQVKGAPEKRTALFVAARSGDTILFYKPLTASQEMQLTVRETEDGDRLAWMGGSLFFRPPGFKDPQTKLCHETLSWRIETAGDVNSDGAVDWVDAGIAYRQRYIKPNPHKTVALRDSYRFYHPLPGQQSYQKLLAMVEKLDFASGLFWMKGMMKTNLSPASEAHPYTVERWPAAGDLSQHKSAILAQGATIGPYYGHDYIDITNGDWPDELIKRDANGGPHKYYAFRGRQLYYKDNVRGIATGALKEHYEQILKACWLQPGDTVMLDTYSAYARPGYHPEFPATVQNEIEAKHELARWLKHDKGLVVTGESIIDGMQDVVDYGSVAIDLAEMSASSPWNRGWVPMKEVIFHGSTYFGCSAYSARRPDVNYAAALATLTGLWQWTTLSADKPEQMYNMAARDFFLEDIFWSRLADHTIVDVEQWGSELTYKFANGSTLWVDPEKRKYWLEEAGVRYDGFTPFNNKGVMAIIQQGDFDIVLPIKEMLEIIPSQPNREKLNVAITREPDGRIRVKGNFSNVPFKVVHYYAESDWKWIDAEPVLMLRRVATN
jgi:hypothetical protein